MSTKVGELFYEIVAHSGAFDKSLDDSSKKAKQFANQFSATGDELSKVGGKMTTFLTLPILGIGAAMLKSASDMENYQTSFTTLLQSADGAKTMLADLKKFAASTPFGFADLAQSSKTLLGFGQSAASIMPTIRMLGDVAQGNKEKFQQLTLAYAQIQSTGRLMGQDLLQLINAGFNPLTIIAQQTGKSVGELKKEMEGGAISAEMVANAFKTATSEGGLFFGGMEAASKTLSGQWSTLMDDLAELGRQFGEMLIPIARDVIKWISGVVQWFGSLDEGTKKMILTIAGIAVVAGPAISAIGGIMTAVTAFNPVVLGITVAVIALVAGLAYLVSSMKDTSKEWHSMEDTVKANTKSVEDYKKSLVGIDFGAMNVSQLKKGISETNKEIEKLQESLKKKPETQTAGFVLNIKSDQTDKTKENNAELQRQIEIQNKINQLIANRDLAQEQLNEKTKQNTVILSEQEKKNMEIREEFRQEQLTDVEQEIEAINAKAEKYKKAGADKVEVEKWASAQIDNIISASIAESEAKEKEASDERIRIKEEEAKKKSDLEKQYLDAGLSYASSITSQLSSIVSMGYQNELTELDNLYGRKLEAIDADYESKKAAIENSLDDETTKNAKLKQLDKDYAKNKEAVEKEKAMKEAEIKKKAFEAQKAASVISAIISTAQGVASAIAQAQLFPFNFILAGIIGALGAVQVATIASQPVPEFAQSGTVLPRPGGSLAIVGDNREQEHIMGDALFRQVLREELIRAAANGGISQNNNFYGDINSDIDLDMASQQQARRLQAMLRGR